MFLHKPENKYSFWMDPCSNDLDHSKHVIQFSVNVMDGITLFYSVYTLLFPWAYLVEHQYNWLGKLKIKFNSLHPRNSRMPDRRTWAVREKFLTLWQVKH